MSMKTTINLYVSFIWSPHEIRYLISISSIFHISCYFHVCHMTWNQIYTCHIPRWIYTRPGVCIWYIPGHKHVMAGIYFPIIWHIPGMYLVYAFHGTLVICPAVESRLQCSGTQISDYQGVYYSAQHAVSSLDLDTRRPSDVTRRDSDEDGTCQCCPLWRCQWYQQPRTHTRPPAGSGVEGAALTSSASVQLALPLPQPASSHHRRQLWRLHGGACRRRHRRPSSGDRAKPESYVKTITQLLCRV